MRVLYVVLLTLAAVVPVRAQDLSIEQRLQRLEAEVRELRAENEALRRNVGAIVAAATPKPTPSPTPVQEQPAAARSAGTPATLLIGGLIQAQGESGDAIDSRFADGNGRFFLRRARINATGRFTEKVDYRVELDLAGSLSNTSAMRAQLTDGYITWTRFPAAWVRVGQFKTPFGYEQLISDPRMPAPERSLVNDRLTAGRQLGAMLGGDLAGKRVNYSAGIFNGSATNQSFNDNDRFLIAGRIAGDLYKGDLAGRAARWSAGANGLSSTDASVSMGPDFLFDLTPTTAARDNLFAGDRTGFGVDTQLALDRFDFAAEYLRMTFDPENAIPFDRFRSDGWYAQASWYLLPKRLQLLTRYETFDPIDRLTGASTDTWSGGLNYYLKGHDVKLQLYYLLSDPAGPGGSKGRVLARFQTAF